MDPSSVPPPKDLLPRARRFGAKVSEAVHFGVDHLLSFPGEEVLELVVICRRVGVDHDEVAPHFQIAEEAQEVPGHTVPSVTGTQPDSDIVVVPDIEDDPPVPAAVLHRRQAEQTEKLRDRDDGRIVSGCPSEISQRRKVRFDQEGNVHLCSPVGGSRYLEGGVPSYSEHSLGSPWKG